MQHKSAKVAKKELSETSLEEIKERVNMKNDHRVRIDLTQASSSNETLLREVIRQNCGEWRVSSKKATLNYVFSKLDDQKLVSMLKKGKIISRYPNIKDLSHKDLFARQMKLCSELAPGCFNFVPP